MTEYPDPPVNVRVEMWDGTLVPVDTVFDKYEDDIAVWRAIDVPEGTIVALRIDALPGQTSVRLYGKLDE